VETNNKTTVALIYGGTSLEHEISLLSAQEVFSHLIKLSYLIVLIGITKSGKWYLQNNALQQEQGKFTIEEEKRCEIAFHPSQGLILLETQEPIHIDVAFPLTHGKGGEDGTLQGILETLNISYIGPSPLSSMIGMNKSIAKMIVQQCSVPVVPSIHLSSNDINHLLKHKTLTKKIGSLIGEQTFSNDSLEKFFTVCRFELGSSFVIKPDDEGSSVGVEVLINPDSATFFTTLQNLSNRFSSLLIEQYISDMVEVECALIVDSSIVASEPQIIENPNVENSLFLTYQQKYFSEHPYHISEENTLPSSIKETIVALATLVGELILNEGFARIDFFYQRKTNTVYFNEINTIPGLTKQSMFPILARQAGYPFPRFLTTMIEQKVSKRS
jgi:D-alanine-D-alanine ligase